VYTDPIKGGEGREEERSKQDDRIDQSDSPSGIIQ
jgi:hypothetical protein